MAVNFYKNRDEILEAWREVLDEKQPATDWAVYGYHKQTNDLELVSKGSGLDDLGEELNSCKILYAICKVIDPNTELSKIVLINWQGEGAPLARKGLCANHVNDIKSFFKGIHLTINARTEEEIEPKVILDKLTKSTATKLSLKDRSNPNDVNPLPVGTNYTRVQAAKEINNSDRESFWNQQQEEEKRRKIEERKRNEDERRKNEEKEKLRELQEAKDRELLVTKKEVEMNKRREEEKNAENRARSHSQQKSTSSTKSSPASSNSESQDNDNSHTYDDGEDERSKRSEIARRERAAEAKNLISGSSIKNARAMFEQNTSSAITSPKATSGIDVTPKRKLTPAITNSNGTNKPPLPSAHIDKPVKQTISPAMSPANMSPPAIIAAAKPEIVAESLLKREPSPKPSLQNDVVQEEDEDEEEDDEDNEDEEGEYQISASRVSYSDLPPIEQHALEDIQEEAEEDEGSLAKGDTHNKQPIGDQGLRARALYDYQAADETEISFDPDDILTHVDMIDPGWYQGFGPDGSYGLFPANYVELLDD